MPELPEVQTLVNDLNAAGFAGTTITGARVYWPRTVVQLSPEDFSRQVTGRTVASIRRRGKYIVFEFIQGPSLLVHLRMTGRLHIAAAGEGRSAHEHVLLSFDDGRQLRLHDTRKFGRLQLVEDAAAFLRHLGVEPLSERFTPEVLADIVKSRKRMLKPLLLDQRIIAGLGNIYADEALWDARLHPKRISCSLSNGEVGALCRAVPRVLRRGLHNLGTTLGTGAGNFYSVARRRGRNGDRLRVFRRTGLPCPRCRTPVERIRVGQRSTHICPVCQAL